MGVFVRSQSDPFNQRVRERIFGFNSSRFSNAGSSSGSEHDAVSSSSSCSSCYSEESPCLSYLVQNFLEDGDGADTKSDVGDSAAEESGDAAEMEDRHVAGLIRDVIHPIASSNGDRLRTDMFAHVSRAMEAFSLFRRDRSAFNRSVMAYLRQIGYNAGVCKTKWEKNPGGSLAAGDHEFIDVILPFPDSSTRYLIDLDFASNFEIARAIDSHRKLLDSLPRVFVGKSDDLRTIVRVMADEARRSMKINGMSLPPWRKNRYMQLKWFGPYRRTVNQVPTSSAALSSSAVKRRSVGFFTDSY